MKILVLTCNTGGGHSACAKYIADEFKKNGIKCVVGDYLSILGKKATKIIEGIHGLTVKGNATLFKNLYHLGELYDKTDITSPVYLANKMVSSKLLAYIKRNKYDVIICPHLYPSLAVSALKNSGEDLKLINVATDYRVVPFWDETCPDYFVIPSKLLKKDFIDAGFDENILIETGIPIASDLKYTKKLKLPIDKKKILITTGSIGFGHVKKLTNDLLNKIDAYVIVICGKNDKMYKELKRIKNKNLIVKKYIHNLNDYIASSDVVLTKPGGITSTEVAILNKPIIHIMPIPGVESYNIDFFVNNKMSLYGKNNKEIIEYINKIFNDDNISKEMISNQKRIINPNSAKDFVKFVIKNLK